MILRGFCDILRFRLITFTLTLITPDNTKTESNSCFITHRFKGNNEKRIMFKKRINQPCSYFTVRMMPYHPRELDIALGNRGLRAQPTDYSITC